MQDRSGPSYGMLRCQLCMYAVTLEHEDALRCHFQQEHPRAVVDITHYVRLDTPFRAPSYGGSCHRDLDDSKQVLDNP
jgi:hypothetical protein